MIIKLFNNEGTDAYIITMGHRAEKIWVGKECGEGGDFDINKFNNILFDAIDKFYKENF